MLIEGCYNLIEKCLYNTYWSVSPLVKAYGFGVNFLPEAVKIFLQTNISVVFTHAFYIYVFSLEMLYIPF
jgi:hypothetical protein